MPTIRCVTLDWGDTLAANAGMPYVQSQRRALERLARTLTALGATPGPDWVEQAMTELSGVWASSADPVLNPEHREIDFAGMLDRWLANAEAMGAPPHALGLAIERYLADLTEVIAVYAESLPTLSLLKARGLRIGILSHVSLPPQACRAWFSRHGLAPYIDFYSFSSEVGWIKPNPRHFQHALGLAGVPPEAILHVGDHPLRDVRGAAAMRMRTCLRLTQGIYPPAELSACAADLEILRIGELPEALTRLPERPLGR